VSGRAVAIGAGHGEAKVSAVQLLMNEIVVTGSRHSTRAEFIETMELMARGTIRSVVGERVPFTEVESLFDKLAHEQLLGRGALTYDT
jgi:D-arabinose 1-dehydrogenase-like Zn-dependent alcohol dehydrogenase